MDFNIYSRIKKMSYPELLVSSKEVGNEIIFLDLIEENKGIDEISKELGLQLDYEKFNEKLSSLSIESKQYVELIGDFKFFLLSKICDPAFGAGARSAEEE